MQTGHITEYIAYSGKKYQTVTQQHPKQSTFRHKIVAYLLRVLPRVGSLGGFMTRRT